MDEQTLGLALQKYINELANATQRAVLAEVQLQQTQSELQQARHRIGELESGASEAPTE
jgi:hypothetical protein